MVSTKNILLGFVVGGTISAAATLLTTPSSGENIRNRVKEQGLEWKNIADDIIRETIRLKDQLAKTSKEGVALISELTEDMKTSVDEWKHTIEPHQENIYEYLEQIESSIKDLEQKITDSKQK